MSELESVKPWSHDLMFASRSEDWFTPQCVLDCVYTLGPVELDPCGHARALVQASTVWTGEEGRDGLRLSWRGYSLVYVNPPYGRKALNQWVAKACDSAARRRLCDEIVLLVPARTDTRWWYDCYMSFVGVCFIRGRLHFLRTDGVKRPAPFPSAVFYAGERWEVFYEAFKGLALMWRFPASVDR